MLPPRRCENHTNSPQQQAARSAPETAARIKTQRLRRSSKFPDIIQTIKDVGADTKTFAKLAETAALETIPKSQTAKDFRKGAKEACSSLKKLLNTAGVTEEKTLAFARLMRQHYAASFLVKVSKAINKTEHGDAVSSALRTALQQIETQQQGMPAVEQEHQDELAVDPSVSEDEDDEDDEDYMASEASDYESDDTLMDEVVKDEFPIPITYRYAEMPAPQHSNEAEAFTRAVSELSLEHIAQDEQEPNFQQQQAVHSLSKEQSVALVQTSYGSPESLVKKQNALNVRSMTRLTEAPADHSIICRTTSIHALLYSPASRSSRFQTISKPFQPAYATSTSDANS